MNPLFRLIFLVILFFLASNDVSAQISLYQNRDFSGLKVDQLSDADVMKYYQQSVQLGLAESDLFRIFTERGMPADEIRKLKERFSALNAVPATSALSNGVRYQEPASEAYLQPEEIDSTIFGADLFYRSSTVFEPNLRIPAPASYQLGPDDELLINVYGLSEKSYQLTISNEGEIYIPNVGPVNLSGLTLEKATAVIKAKLSSSIYSSLNNGRTMLQVSLGKIKSIRVTVIGQVKQAGTFTVSSLSTLYNLLFVCGGPSKQGSFRNIELIRDSKVFKTVDLYQFLVFGNQTQNVLLQEGDVIRIPYAENMVKVEGRVKRVGKFEMKNTEHVSDLLNYCGGFEPNAYRNSVGLSKISENGKVMNDISESSFATTSLSMGDELFVNAIRDKYLNRVAIFGFVTRPGYYQLQDSMSLKQLIGKAGGVMPEAYLKTASIYRIRENQIPEILSVNLESELNEDSGLVLRNGDSAYVNSRLDFIENMFVNVDGYVQKPMRIKWRENLSLFDVISEAGGVTVLGDSGRVEISRRVIKEKGDVSSVVESEAIVTDLNKNISLRPFDLVYVRNNPGIVNQRLVLLTGEVRYPGKYILTRSGERLSDIIQRAEGYNYSADSLSITIRRKSVSKLNKEERERIFERLLNLNQDSLGSSSRLSSEIFKDYELVSINTRKARRKYKSADNLILEDGDIISIEKRSKLVKVTGEVFFPTVIAHKSGKSARHYIARAGGFTAAAYKKGVIVIYPNGKAKPVKKLLLFRSYPKVRERSEIFVPMKNQNESKKLTYSELAIIVTSMGILANIFIAVFK